MAAQPCQSAASFASLGLLNLKVCRLKVLSLKVLNLKVLRWKVLNWKVLSVDGMASKVMKARLGLRQAGLAAVVVAAALQALPAACREPEAAIRASYLCLGRFDAVSLTALFFNGEPRELVLLQGEQAIRLPQQPSGSGARYGAGAQSFWLKGDRATWQVGQAPAYACTVQPQGSPGGAKRP